MNIQEYQSVFDQILLDLSAIKSEGEVANYIPELGGVDPNKFGMHLIGIDHAACSVGDARERFSIQSISKVFSLTLALKLLGDEVWERVGVEPSGSAFNSLVQLEYEQGIPRNPFINAGALVICDILLSVLSNPKVDMLAFIRKTYTGSTVAYNPRVAQSEMVSGFRNRALINLMRDFGNIHNPIESVLDFYFTLCSIEMTCEELAKSFLFLAANGTAPDSGEVIVIPQRAKRINSIMQLCGFYDEAGEFSFSVGLPGKSGVGGGIVTVFPGKFSLAVWSPRLNAKGNSFKGMKALEWFTTRTRLSIF